MPVSILNLPVEVLLDILLLVGPVDLVHISRTCRPMRDAVDKPVIWRTLCQDYRYWNDLSSMKARFHDMTTSFEWRKAFSDRYAKARRVRKNLASSLESRKGRIEKLHRIAAEGYEAKDTLLEEIKREHLAEDGLCRAYYARTVLGHIQRALAIEEWEGLFGRPQQRHSPLEHIFGAFDLFLLGDRKGDFDEMSSTLDALADEVRNSVTRFEELPKKKQAMIALRHLRAREYLNFPQEDYHALRHNFMALALMSSSHTCLPLIATAIYCAVARRLGIDARPINFPFHIHAVVFENSDFIDTADIDISLGLREAGLFYVDPSRSDEEVPADRLRSELVSVGAGVVLEEIKVLTLPEAFERFTRNLARSIKTAAREEAAAEPTDVMDYLHQSESVYCMLWAIAASTSTWNPQLVNVILREMATDYQIDWPFAERFRLGVELMSPYGHAGAHDPSVMKTTDQSTPRPKPRSEIDDEAEVNYKVGQIFRHKRYFYTAVIVGWDESCAKEEDWIRAMAVDSLPNGRSQSFYHVLDTGNNARYVAEENIEIQTPGAPPCQLLRFAGKYFKRWDSETKTFVSNIKEEYPDD